MPVLMGLLAGASGMCTPAPRATVTMQMDAAFSSWNQQLQNADLMEKQVKRMALPDIPVQLVFEGVAKSAVLDGKATTDALFKAATRLHNLDTKQKLRFVLNGNRLPANADLSDTALSNTEDLEVLIMPASALNVRRVDSSQVGGDSWWGGAACASGHRSTKTTRVRVKDNVAAVKTNEEFRIAAAITEEREQFFLEAHRQERDATIAADEDCDEHARLLAELKMVAALAEEREEFFAMHSVAQMNDDFKRAAAESEEREDFFRNANDYNDYFDEEEGEEEEEVVAPPVPVQNIQRQDNIGVRSRPPPSRPKSVEVRANDLATHDSLGSARAGLESRAPQRRDHISARARPPLSRPKSVEARANDLATHDALGSARSGLENRVPTPRARRHTPPPDVSFAAGSWALDSPSW